MAPRQPEYKAFISYSRNELGVARAISRGLEQLAKPRRSRRAFDVFLDQEELPAGGPLPERLIASLDASEFLVLIASPSSATSGWVNREVGHWVESRGTDRILIALADGDLEWEPEAGRFAGGEAVLPSSLDGHFTEPPIWIDVRDESRAAQADPDSVADRMSLENAEWKLKIATLQAPLRGEEVVPSDIVGRDLELWRDAQRRRRRAIGALIALTIASVVAGLIAIEYARRSAAQERAALSRQLASQSVEVGGEQLDVALLLSIEAYRADQTVQAYGSLINSALRSDDVMRFLHGHTKPLRSVAYDDNGSLLASTGTDGSVRLWDAATLEPIGEPLVPQFRDPSDSASLRDVAFSPTDPLLVAAGLDGLVHVWDISNLDAIETRAPFDAGSDASVFAIAFSPNGSMLATSGDVDEDVSGMREIALWDVESRARAGSLPGHGDLVLDLAFSPRGNILASASTDDTAALWDVPTGAQLATIDSHEDNVSAIAFAPDGLRLATAGWDEIVRVWDITEPANPRPISTFTGHDDIVRSVAFNGEGDTVASGGRDQRVLLWNPDTGEPTRELSASHASEVWSVSFDPARPAFASGSADEKVAVWRLDGGSSLATTLHAGNVRSVLFDPERRLVVTGGDQGSDIRWYPLGSADPPQPSDIPTDALALASDELSHTIASGGLDGTITLWDPETQERIQTIDVLPSAVRSVAFNPVRPMLAAGTGDGTIALVQLPADEDADVHTDLSVDGTVWDLTFSPDGSQLAASNGDDSVLLWNLDREEPITIAVSSEVVTSVDFSPRGEILAVGGSDGDVVLLDPRTGVRIGQPMTGHRGPIQDVAFDPSGRILASASSDATVILWDVGTRLPVADPLVGHPGRVFSVDWLDTGHGLVTGGRGAALLWDLRPTTLRRTACATANRNLSEDEWDGFVGDDRTYRRSC